jgi:hypothetical protein
VPITRQKSPVFSIVSLPTDSVNVDHAVSYYPSRSVYCRYNIERFELIFNRVIHESEIVCRYLNKKHSLKNTG